MRTAPDGSAVAIRGGHAGRNPAWRLDRARIRGYVQVAVILEHGMELDRVGRDASLAVVEVSEADAGDGDRPG